jgi:hypothetical protein
MNEVRIHRKRDDYVIVVFNLLFFSPLSSFQNNITRLTE